MRQRHSIYTLIARETGARSYGLRLVSYSPLRTAVSEGAGWICHLLQHRFEILFWRVIAWEDRGQRELLRLPLTVAEARQVNPGFVARMEAEDAADAIEAAHPAT